MRSTTSQGISWNDESRKRLTELFEKHYKAAFSLAFRITQDAQAAHNIATDQLIKFSQYPEFWEAAFYKRIRQRSIDFLRARAKSIVDFIYDDAKFSEGEQSPLDIAREKRLREQEALSAEHENPPANDEESGADLTRQREEVTRFVREHLSPRQQAIYDLKNREIPQAEAAKELKITENALKLAWRRLKAILRAKFPDYFS